MENQNIDNNIMETTEIIQQHTKSPNNLLEKDVNNEPSELLQHHQQIEQQQHHQQQQQQQQHENEQNHQLLQKELLPPQKQQQNDESDVNDSDLSDSEIEDYSLNESFVKQMRDIENISLGIKRKRKLQDTSIGGGNTSIELSESKKVKNEGASDAEDEGDDDDEEEEEDDVVDKDDDEDCEDDDDDDDDNRSTTLECETLNLTEMIKQGVELDKPVELLDILDESVVQLAKEVLAKATEFDDSECSDIDDEPPELKAVDEMDFDISEKLREMGEISVKPVLKGEISKKNDLDLDEISLEITRKGGIDDLTDDKRKITNLRKNIREVMDDNQLDASTLAAQRQELERLARVQEQQRIIRDVQRQIALDRQNNKTQTRVLSLLQGHTSLLKNSNAGGPSSSKVTLPGTGGTVLMKIPASEAKSRGLKFGDSLKQIKTNLTPSVSIAPVKAPVKKEKPEPEEPPMEITKIEEPQVVTEDAASKAKKDVVTIVDSSDDDCIVLSDDEESEVEDDDPQNSGLHVNDQYNIPDDQGRVVINIGHPEGEADIFVAPQISRIIKPHQIGGVRFLFDNVIESTDRFDSSTGFGCILAHSMGLGKTLQLVCFCDIFLRHTNSKTILCIMPINTLQNWLAEFNMWLPEDSDRSPLRPHGEVRPRNFKLYVLNDSHKTLTARSKIVLQWAKEGGVLLIGYEMYRLLSLKKMTKKKKGKKVPEVEQEQTEEQKCLLDEIHTALVKPGPDLVICDEGHRIKNSHASISVALKQIRSKRRIVLTGYPLQNNLQEYWCMVDFVRPNYLGTKSEFMNMFERPIQNGQCIDSTPQDIKLMRYRAHVLHSLLLGFVQRRSHAVLQTSLPQKEEYVLLVRMTEFQRKLYDVFMNEVVRKKAVPNPLKAFAVCCKIWNHPDVLYNFLRKREADLDLEIEEAEQAANGQLIKGKGKRNGSPRKPRTKKQDQLKMIDKNGKPAATISPNTGGISGNFTSEQDNKGTTSLNQSTSNFNTIIKTETDTNINFPLQIKEEPNDIKKIVTNQDIKCQPPGQNTGTTAPSSIQHVDYPGTYHNYETQNYDNFNPYGNYNDYNNPYGHHQNNQQNQQSYNYSNQNFNNNYPNYNQNSGNNNNFPPTSNDYWQNNQGYYSNNMDQYNQNYPNYGVTSYGSSNYSGHQNQQSHQQQSNQQLTQQQPQSNYDQNYPYSDTSRMDGAQNWPPNPTTQNSTTNITENENKSVPEDEKPQAIVDLDTKEIKLEACIIKKEEPKPIVDTEDVKLPDDASVKDEKEEIEKDLKAISPSKDDGIPYDWAIDLMKGYIADMLDNSPKMEIFFCILEESLKLGDRMLVFSQSLLTLNLIEKFLQKNKIPGTESFWFKNTNYYRLDGSTAAIEREKLINEFNSNPNIHLFLVSTRAGSLGINLVGANRVIVFDASWNPCHDTQAVCRVYRYGQKKPCFVYRLVMDNCLEKRIYDRQVNKQGMSDRVVDECNPDAHLSLKEVTNLCWDDEEESDIRDFSDCKDKYLDIVMQKIIESHSKSLSKEPFQHESLLVDRKEKKLSSAEKRLAQRGYELEKQAAARPTYMYNSNMGTQYRAIRTPDGSIVHRPVASVRPMQAEMGDKVTGARPGGARPTRWIPAEVWQRQGMSAQEMTLPLDVVIPTSSAEKANIVLKAGQKVMVLKSPKGIYMQLESGKIIAIRTAFKMGQTKDKVNSPTSGIKVDQIKKIQSPRPAMIKPVPTSNQTTIVGIANQQIGTTANLPANLKNNSSITVMPTQKIGTIPGQHITSSVTPNRNRITTMQSIIKNRQNSSIINKNIQFGTARPYNLKQAAGKLQFKSIMKPLGFVHHKKDLDDNSAHSSDGNKSIISTEEINDLSKDDDEDDDEDGCGVDECIDEIDDDEENEIIEALKTSENDNAMQIPSSLLTAENTKDIENMKTFLYNATEDLKDISNSNNSSNEIIEKVELPSKSSISTSTSTAPTTATTTDNSTNQSGSNNSDDVIMVSASQNFPPKSLNSETFTTTSGGGGGSYGMNYNLLPSPYYQMHNNQYPYMNQQYYPYSQQHTQPAPYPYPEPSQSQLSTLTQTQTPSQSQNQPPNQAQSQSQIQPQAAQPQSQVQSQTQLQNQIPSQNNTLPHPNQSQVQTQPQQSQPQVQSQNQQNQVQPSLQSQGHIQSQTQSQLQIQPLVQPQVQSQVHHLNQTQQQLHSHNHAQSQNHAQNHMQSQIHSIGQSPINSQSQSINNQSQILSQGQSQNHTHSQPQSQNHPQNHEQIISHNQNPSHFNAQNQSSLIHPQPQSHIHSRNQNQHQPQNHVQNSNQSQSHTQNKTSQNQSQSQIHPQVQSQSQTQSQIQPQSQTQSQIQPQSQSQHQSQGQISSMVASHTKSKVTPTSTQSQIHHQIQSQIRPQSLSHIPPHLQSQIYPQPQSQNLNPQSQINNPTQSQTSLHMQQEGQQAQPQIPSQNQQPNNNQQSQSHPQNQQPNNNQQSQSHPQNQHRTQTPVSTSQSQILHQPHLHQPQLHQPQLHQPQLHQPQLHQPQLHQPQLHQPQLHQPHLHQPHLHQPQLQLHTHQSTQNVKNTSSFQQQQQHQPHLPLATPPSSYASSYQSTQINISQPSYITSVTTPSQTQTKPRMSAVITNPIMIDDDIDPPLREKIIYKPNLIERKPRQQVDHIQQQPPQQPPPQQHHHQHHHPQHHQQQHHQHQNQYQQHNHQQGSPNPLPITMPQASTKTSLKNYRHKANRNQPTPVMNVNPEIENNTTSTGPDPIITQIKHDMNPIGEPTYHNIHYQHHQQSMYPQMIPQMYDPTHTSHMLQHHHQLHNSRIQPQLKTLTKQQQATSKIESSLSFLEKTTSAINDNKNGFQASLSNITRSYSPSPVQQQIFNEVPKVPTPSPVTKPKRQNTKAPKKEPKPKKGSNIIVERNTNSVEPLQSDKYQTNIGGKSKISNMQNITSPFPSIMNVPSPLPSLMTPVSESITPPVSSAPSTPLFSGPLTYPGYSGVPSVLSGEQSTSFSSGVQHYPSYTGGYVPQYPSVSIPPPISIPPPTTTSTQSNILTTTSSTITSSVQTYPAHTTTTPLSYTSSLPSFTSNTSTAFVDQGYNAPPVSGSAFHRPDGPSAVPSYTSPYPPIPPPPTTTITSTTTTTTQETTSVPTVVPSVSPYIPPAAYNPTSTYHPASSVPPPTAYQTTYSSQYPQVPQPSVPSTPTYPPYGYPPSPYVTPQYPPSHYPPLSAAGYDQRYPPPPTGTEQYPAYTPGYSFPPYTPQPGQWQ